MVNKVLTPPVLTHEQLSENGLFIYELPRRFREFSLVDQHGQAFTQEQLQGKWSLVFFGYTFCPDICPITLATIRQFHRMLEGTGFQDDTQVVMVSVDPQRDTLDKLKDYMAFFDEDYIGATGEYIDIFNLASQLNIAFQYIPTRDQEGEYLVSHSGEIILINPEGHFHGFFKVPPDPDRMKLTYMSVRNSFR
jgi:protein SCO1